MAENVSVMAIDAVLKGKESYCKFLSANDSGETGGHQSGILISKSAKAMLWSDQAMKDNHILKRYGKIKWQNDYITDCTFTWYESKNELRITGFGRGRSPLNPDYTGALFVIIKDSEEDFQGYLLNTENDIEAFLETFGLTPAETNRPIEVNRVDPQIKERQAIDTFINGLNVDFPASSDVPRHFEVAAYCKNTAN